MPVAAVSSHQADLDVDQEMRDVPDPAGRSLIVGAIPGEPPGSRLRAEALAVVFSGATRSDRFARVTKQEIRPPWAAEVTEKPMRTQRSAVGR